MMFSATTEQQVDTKVHDHIASLNISRDYTAVFRDVFNKELHNIC
jgi:hypothetical protein